MKKDSYFVNKFTFPYLYQLFAMVSEGRVYIEEETIELRGRLQVTVYCHRKQLSKIRNLDWYSIRPFGVEVFILPMNFARLKVNCQGHRFYCINIVHSKRAETLLPEAERIKLGIVP